MTDPRDTQFITALACEQGKLILFRRLGSVTDQVSLDIEPFLLADFFDVPGAETVHKLSGNNPLCCKAVFPDSASYEAAYPELKKTPGVRLFKDCTQMAYLDMGLRLFGGMEFSDLRRMQISVESDEKGVACKVTVSGSGGDERSLSGTPQEVTDFFLTETSLRDPDVIEGHDLNSKILPALEKAAKKAKIPLAFGRTDTPAVFRTSRFTSAEKVVSYRRCDVPGRHLVDTGHLAIFCDSRTRSFDSFELDYLADFYGFSGSVNDITRQLADMWEPSYFYCTKMLPQSFQDSILRGTGSSLELLLISEYLKRGASIPYPQEGRSYPGALTRAEKYGVYKNVRHCDVRSHYPSIISAWDLAPDSDSQRIFPELLRSFLEFRIQAKERSRTAETALEREHASQLHQAYKILINSFYGYLGFAQGSFNDYDMAEKVTSIGRDILTGMFERLNALGAAVIEMDTDGIYFVSPGDISADELEKEVKKGLPEGICLEFDADYPAMFSYKSKNYALLTRDGKVELTGSALRSRSLEPFQRRYIETVCRELLHGTAHNIRAVYDRMYESISEGTIPLRELVKSEVLSDSTDTYRKKLSSGSGRRSAAYEVALAAGLKLKSGETVRYYVTGDKKRVTVAENSRLYIGEDGERDENRAYYCAKLEELAENFRVFEESVQ
ncbi:MAG: hypothetical protein J6W67_00050 [Lentisphaeria bacterium]|nr:hypothetical protein [Lentisphaeria bacterium]